MANNRPTYKDARLTLDIFEAMLKAGIPRKDVNQVRRTSSCTGYQWHSLFQAESDQSRLLRFLQATIDDDRATVRTMLNIKPKLLLINPPANMVIESQYTWQKFYAESALKMAAKRKQIEMLKIMLPYLDQLEQTEQVAQAKADVVTAWNPQDDIIIPDEYASYVQSLIDVFIEETFPDGKLSDETELALSSLFDRLLPEQAVKLGDYLDPELFLLALYKAYDAKFDTFQNWNQHDAFCIRVIGLTQSVLSPETAKIFCVGLYYVVENGRKISERAAGLKLFIGGSFYRPGRESLSGLGFEYLIDGGGRVACGAGGACAASAQLEKLC